MAQYTYKGYVANVYEDKLRETWSTCPPEELTFIATLRSEFCSYISKPCNEDEVSTVRNMFIKYFERAVDKHIDSLK